MKSSSSFGRHCRRGRGSRVHANTGFRCKRTCAAADARAAAKSAKVTTGVSPKCMGARGQEGLLPSLGRAAAAAGAAMTLLAATPLEGFLEARAAGPCDAPSTSYAPLPALVRQAPTPSAGAGRMLHSAPLMSIGVQGTGASIWVQLGAIIAANVVVIQGVLKLFGKLRDRSGPVTLVKLQLGLVTDHTGIRSRLAELSSMIKVGGKGVWIILEEALLELSKYQSSCKLADVAAVHLISKSEAYDLFGEVAKSEVQRARQEEAFAHLEGEGECSMDWEGTGSSSGSSSRRSKLMQWLQGPEESDCDDALVVTLVVAARGDLDIPSTVSSWADLAGVMKTLGGLSSEQLMALDLTWSPSKDNEFLTREQLVRDYTTLKPVRR